MIDPRDESTPTTSYLDLSGSTYQTTRSQPVASPTREASPEPPAVLRHTETETPGSTHPQNPNPAPRTELIDHPQSPAAGSLHGSPGGGSGYTSSAATAANWCRSVGRAATRPPARRGHPHRLPAGSSATGACPHQQCPQVTPSRLRACNASR